jgi:hypothetical protein
MSNVRGNGGARLGLNGTADVVTADGRSPLRLLKARRGGPPSAMSRAELRCEDGSELPESLRRSRLDVEGVLDQHLRLCRRQRLRLFLRERRQPNCCSGYRVVRRRLVESIHEREGFIGENLRADTIARPQPNGQGGIRR